MTQIDYPIPDGYEFVRVGSKPGDLMVTVYGHVVQCDAPFPNAIVVRKAIEWPEWLLADWVVRDYDGCVYGFTGNRPTQHSDGWSNDGNSMLLDPECIDLSWLLDVPWEESCFENPRSWK